MKRTFITLGRIFSAGAKNFIRNSWLSVAATAVMVVAITIVLMAIVLNTTARNAIKELSKSLKISVYIKDGVAEDSHKELEKAIRTNPDVANVEYVSVEAARERFSESFQNDQQLLQGLTLVGADTLPASLEISVSNLEKINEVADIAKDTKYESVVESITLGKTDAKKTIERAAAAKRFIVSASILAASIFGGVSVLIIFNTIRMAIFTRNEEIKIMKLIGATPNYIRGPFLVEASIYGVIAGCIATTAVYSLVLSVGTKVATQAEFRETYNFFVRPSMMMALLLGAIIAGVLVAFVSSMLAMERYLKLKQW